MYPVIDFLIPPEQTPYVIEINVGLPGKAQEYLLTQMVHFGRPSDIFVPLSKRISGLPGFPNPPGG